jgi:DNA mismatch repair ATPase MutS
VLTVAFSGQIHSFFRGILNVPQAQPYSYLSDTFAHVSDASEVRQLLPETSAACEQAVRNLKRLERILLLESVGGNPFTTAFVYIPLQFLLLWDLQVYVAASDWREASGENLELWFQSLGEVEATCSLASLGFEQPTWVYPDVGESNAETFTSQGLGHPLLPDQSRIVNDVQIGPSGSLLLITGSNMGGKSTLLRAVGLNVVLAQAGAPCCCRTLKMPLLTVMTSMRVSDSLSDSTSLFMAQLLQMKTIVDHLRNQQDGSKGTLVMYLFDEILNGTNTTDRRRAVEELVGYLLRCRAIGAMTTHDLEIATQSKHKDAFQTYYLAHQLEESGENPELKFDYKLRQGVSPSSNAMLLVRLLGIPKA